MPLCVLNVAYPLAPVGRDSAGGSEQVVSLIDRALATAQHRSIVIAMRSSSTAGELLPLPEWSPPLDGAVRKAAKEAVRRNIHQALNRYPVDVVHLHGIDFLSYLPARDVPVLVTLHLPLAWYGAELVSCQRPNVVYCCVSESQSKTCPPQLAPVRLVPNGVCAEDLLFGARKKPYALLLTRICPEKGIHLAIEAARRAECPLIIAGEIYGYPAHREYFDQQVAPLLDQQRRFIGPAGFEMKRTLLAEARCLLVPSLVEETSSLVTMEALASGTPVIAFRKGALCELVRDTETAFLVNDVEEMAAAIRNTGRIQPSRCRDYALRNFSARNCFLRYLALYHELAGQSRLGGIPTGHASAEVGELPDAGRRAGVILANTA